MKKIIKSVIGVLIFSTLMISLFSCGSKEVVVTPVKSTISGPLGNFFKIVERNYKVKDGCINIEFERVANGLPNPWTEGVEVGYSDNKVEPGFLVEFIDSDGDVICKDQTDIVWEKDELVSVVALGVGETSTIPFGANSTKDVVSFKVTSTFKYHEPTVESSSSTTVSNTKNNASALSEWDGILDDYEKVVNKFISVFNKAMAGDVSAMSSYMDLLDEAQELAEELEGADDEMSVAQMERYTSITNKLTTAALKVL